MASLVMKNGTVTDSSSIETGLSSITQVVLYRNTVDSAGLILGQYNVDLGTLYSFHSSYSSSSGSILTSTTAPSIDGGTFTWNGSGNHAMAEGVEYIWIAIGEE